jgi:hypothetical protein
MGVGPHPDILQMLYVLRISSQCKRQQAIHQVALPLATISKDHCTSCLAAEMMDGDTTEGASIIPKTADSHSVIVDDQDMKTVNHYLGNTEETHRTWCTCKCKSVYSESAG